MGWHFMLCTHYGEGHVFTGICHSVQGGGGEGCLPLEGRGSVFGVGSAFGGKEELCLEGRLHGGDLHGGGLHGGSLPRGGSA